MYSTSDMNDATRALYGLHADKGSWRAVGEYLGVPYYYGYDFCKRRSTMARPRIRAVMKALGIGKTYAYYRPCLSLSTKSEVQDMLDAHPEYTLTDIINCGLEHFEDERR